MNLFIFNLMLFLEYRFGKQVNNPPVRWWIDRVEGEWREVRILNNFNTITFVEASRNRIRTRHHNKPVHQIFMNEWGVKVDPETGKASMWTKRSTNRKGQKSAYQKTNFFEFMTGVERFKITEADKSAYIPLLDEFLARHDAISLVELLIPAAEPLGIPPMGSGGVYGANARTPWMDFALGARNLGDFWTRMGRTIKLNKDEKRALVALIKHDARYLTFARIATRVHVPNIRTLTIPKQGPELNERGFRSYDRDPWGYVTPNSDVVAKWLMGMRNVDPRRRVMILQNWNRVAMDTLDMLADLRKAGVTDMLNLPSVHAYHEQARITLKLIQTQNREIPVLEAMVPLAWAGNDGVGRREKMAINGYPLNGGMHVVAPGDTHTVVAWGENQSHCIGAYANQAADGRTLLLGFKRGDEWVGHCSINGGRCEQLLARFNASLDQEDRKIILTWLKAVGLIKEAKTSWG